MIVDIVYCDAEKDGKCYPRYWKHVPLFLINNLKNSSEAVCFIQEALNPNSYRIAYGYETDKNLDSSEVDEMGAEALLLKRPRNTYMSEEINERTDKHSLHDRDIPLNICIDTINVEDIGILIDMYYFLNIDLICSLCNILNVI